MASTATTAATATGEEEGSSSRPPKFSGKQENYQIFNTRFKAYSRMKGYSGAIDVRGPDPKLPSAGPVAIGNVVYKKDEELAIRNNDKAMYS